MATASLYDTLGIARDATKAAIRRAWRKKVKEKHPDIGGSDEGFRSVNQAYRILIDDGKRSTYDQTGRVEDAAPNTIESEALAYVLGMWQENITRCMMENCSKNSWLSFTDNHIRNISSTVNNERLAARNTLAQIGKGLEYYSGIRKRIKDCKYKELLVAVLDNEVRVVEQSQQQYQHKLEVCDKAIEILNGMEYEADPIPTNGSMLNQMMGANQSYGYGMGMAGIDPYWLERMQNEWSNRKSNP